MPARETKQHNKEQHNKEKAVHKVTPAERTAVDKHFARRESKPHIRLKISKKGNEPQIEFDHPDKQIGQALVMEALASVDWDFLHGILNQLASASANGQNIDERGLNFMLSVIKGIRGNACGPDGGRAHGEHDICAPPRTCENHCPARQRGARVQ